MDPPYGGSISDFIRDPRFGVKKIITWYNLWHSGRSSVPRLALFRYEDFQSDASKEFQRLLAFWQIPIDLASVQAAVDFSSFGSMRKLKVDNVRTHSLVYQSGLSLFATRLVAKTRTRFT